MLGTLGDALTNGTIVLFGGEPPTTPGETPQTAFVIAELRFTSFGGMTAQGTIEAGALRSGLAQVTTSSPRWFQARAADGRVVLDGLVGNGPGELTIEPSQIIQGGRVDGSGFVLGWA